MPLQKLQFRPGVNREGTTLANEGGWFDCDNIRFRSGYPEKLGGWVKDTGANASTLQPPAGAYWGVARSMWNWLNLSSFNLLAVGTNVKYYIQNGADGYLYDVTPIRATTAAGDVTFTATNASKTITVADIAHGAITGDFVTYSGAVTLGGLITADILNAEFQITYVDPNTYTIQSSVAANASDVGSGGSATVGVYQINSGNEIYTFGVGWSAGAWGGTVPGAISSTLNGAINSSVTTITLVSATAFPASGTVLIDSELISYASKNSTQLLTCTRGASGTVAASHLTTTTVQDTATFEAWGTSAASSANTGQQLRLWSQGNYGQDLIFNPRGAGLYYWANNANPNIFDRGQTMAAGSTVALTSGSVVMEATAPSAANTMLISDASRFVIAFGCNDPTGVYATVSQDPLQIRWSQQEQFNVWTPSATNQAGDYRLSHGSTIITATQTRQEILVFTDASVYSMQYLGLPYVWGFQLMGDTISITGPNAVQTVNNVTYWMGTDKFYMYSGRVETLPCALRQYIYDDINLQQSFQIFSGTNEGYNEIWWYYCSISGPNGTGTAANPNTTIDKYVIFNHLERTWYYGAMARTAWIDSPLRAEPMAAFITTSGSSGSLLYHETGNDDGTTSPASPIVSYVQSSDFDIGDGHNFGIVWRIIPDVTFDGSDIAAPKVKFTVRPRQNPGANYGSSDSPSVISSNNYSGQQTYNVQQFTEYAYVRIRGRQMAFKISSSDLGVSWQLGAPRLDVRSDGRR